MTTLLEPVKGADLDTELAHEESCVRSGQEAYQNLVAKRVEKRQEELLDYGKSLINRSIEPLSTAIRDFLVDSKLHPGRRHTAAKYLEEFDPDVVAFITCQEVFSGVTLRSVYQYVAARIGRRLEEELRLARFEKDKPALYTKVQENLEKNPQGFKKIVRKKTLIHAMNKFDVQWQKWPHDAHFHVGFKLIELLIQSTGLVQVVRSPDYRNTKLYLTATPELTDLLVRYKAKAEFMYPSRQPMLVPPKPWSTLEDGGYYNPRLQYKLVVTQTKGHFQELRNNIMPEVYEAVNTLQATPWKVNATMLKTVQEVWDSGLMVKGLPLKRDIPLPVRPFTSEKGTPLSDEQKLAWGKYQAEAADVFRQNLKHGSKRMQVIKTLLLAEKFAPYNAIWFPVRLDFRGRMYAVPNHLNAQGSDLSKSLLVFAEGKPVDERGEFWLAVHLANTFGFDKVGLDERESWARANSWKIEQVGDDPLTNLWWTEADKPFQFLAACLEWNAYLQAKYNGETYVSHLPIMVDGSCNGLQHFSAMLKDEVSGAYVNLVPSPKPQDIYQRVADGVSEFLRNTCNTATSTGFEQQWLDYGIDRKIAKRPTMVLPYGGTRDAVRNYILDAVLEQDEEARKNPGHGKVNPFGKETKKAVGFLATVMWKVMGEVVVGPMEAMKWLRKAAQIVSKPGDMPMTWRVPSGFLVQQLYYDISKRRVKTRVGDTTLKLTVQDKGTSLDKKKQATALAPNFVHSMDAAALMLTINLAKRLGVTSFAAIHDSYGTHAADMDMLQVCLRDVFVEIYRDGSTLQKFASGLYAPEELPAPPPQGTLNVEEVRNCEYFFA